MFFMFLLYFLLIVFFGYFFIVGKNAPTQIDSGISQAVRDANKIFMTKNIFEDGIIETAAVTAERCGFKRNTTDFWPNYGFFKQQPCDFGVEKENLSENSLIYLNQDYQSYKDNKKVYYGDFFIIGQVNETLNPPEDLLACDFMDREVKLFRPRSDIVTGTFQGLYETLGYITVRGDVNEHFLDYGYSKKDSRILHSFDKKRIANSFSGTFFNSHRIQYESGALQTDSSEIFYFLSSTTDRVEEINRHMGSVNLYPIDMS